MSALTWRDVAAGNIGSASDGGLAGYAQFSRLLGDALGGARNTINTIDQQQQQADNNKVAMAAIAAQDPKALEQGLADGSFLANTGVRTERLDPTTIAMLGRRPGELISQNNQQLQLDKGNYAFNQEKTTDERAPLLTQATQLAYQAGLSGDPKAQAAYEAYMAANPDLLKGLSYNTAKDFQTGVMGARKSGLDFTVTGDQNDRSWNEDARSAGRFNMEKTNFNNALEDRQAGIQAQQFLANITESSDPNNPDSVRTALFTGPLAKANPRVRAMVYSQLPPAYASALSAGEMSAGLGAGGAAGGLGNANAATIQVGGGQIPPSVQSVSDAISYGKNTLIPATRNDPRFGLQGTGKGTSAMGLYQITATTLADWAPKVFKGQDLSKVSFTDLANQDKIAHAIFDANRGNPAALAQQWTSLKNPAAVARMPWAQAREIIARGESGGSPTDLMSPGSPSSTLANLQLRGGQDRFGRADAGTILAAAGGPDANPLDVVANLKKDPRFAQTSSEFLRTTLGNIVDQSRVDGKPTLNYNQAAVVLQRATQENHGNGIGSRLWDWMWGGPADTFEKTATGWHTPVSARINSNGDRVNNDMVRSEIARARIGQLPQEAAHNADMDWRATLVNQTTQQMYKAQSDLQDLLFRLPTQPGLAPQVQAARAKLAALQAIAAQAQTGAMSGASPVVAR